MPEIELEGAPDIARVVGSLAGRLPAEVHLPLLSIIVTAYNSERFVRHTLGSIADQSYSAFECVVVEDCSTDGTLAEIEGFLAERRDSRFTLLRNVRNLGQLSAQIAGFHACHGTFVAFVDSDDVLFPDCLETQLAVHLNCEPIAAMICLDSAMIDETGTLLSAHHREIRPGLWRAFRPVLEERSVDVRGERLSCLVVPPSIANTIELRLWCWTTQSFMMFRYDFLRMALPDATERFRVCSDYYIVGMAHAFNTTVIVRRTGGAYRLHGTNHFANAVLTSADQESADPLRFAWQPSELAALAATVIAGRIEDFARVYGDLHVARALIGLPRKVRPGVFRLLWKRMSFRVAVLTLAVVWASRWTARVRKTWRNIDRIIWSGC
ncbi:MAG: glycosyltransferase family A protein [Bryobacteraceae bacterium]